MNTEEMICLVCDWHPARGKRRDLRVLLDHVQDEHMPKHACSYCVEQKIASRDDEKPWRVDAVTVADTKMLEEPAFYCATCGHHRSHVLTRQPMIDN